MWWCVGFGAWVGVVGVAGVAGDWESMMIDDG